MSAGTVEERTRVLLSFSLHRKEVARRLESDLRRARVAVRLDPWEDRGGAPPARILGDTAEGIDALIILLSRSAVAMTWIGEAWRREVFEPARRLGAPMLPAACEASEVPGDLAALGFANVGEGAYAFGVRRLIERLRELTGDAGIEVPAPLEPETPPPAGPEATAPLTVEVGARLGAAITGDGDLGSALKRLEPMMRDGLFFELGVPFPGLQVRRGGADLPPDEARVLLNGIAEASWEVPAESVLVSATAEELGERRLEARPALNPANGRAAAWIPRACRAQAIELGHLTWDATESLVLALSALLRRKAAAFIGEAEVHSMLALVQEAYPRLVAETVPKLVPPYVLAEVLRRLVAEEIHVRDLRSILWTLGQWAPFEPDVHTLAEYVRCGLKRQITHKFTRGRGRLVVFLLHPELEAEIRRAVRHDPPSTYLALTPDRAREIVAAVAGEYAALDRTVELPEILTTLEVRSFVRRLIASAVPHAHVLSYPELSPEVEIQPIGRIATGGRSTRRYVHPPRMR